MVSNRLSQYGRGQTWYVKGLCFEPLSHRRHRRGGGGGTVVE